MTLRQSMALAGRNLAAMLDPGRGCLPRWRVAFGRDMRASVERFWPSHNVGRVWDALLRLEAATGIAVPAGIEGPMTANLAACLANPLGLCGYLEPRVGLPGGPDPAGWCDLHSARELLLAIAALVRWRRSGRALAQGRATVAAMDRGILADGSWDVDAMASACRATGMVLPDDLLSWYAPVDPFRHVESHGRLIEALLEFALASGDERAWALAGRLSRWHLEVCTRPDGSAPEGDHTHTHSYLNTLRGLLLWGQLAGEREFVDRVAVTYAVTVRRYVRRSGFVSHDLRTERDGETGSLGDAIQLALRLGIDGFPALLDDAERWLRSRLLPSQVTAPLGLRPAVEDGSDALARPDECALGAFGGMHAHTHGAPQPTTDITAADLHALCDVYTHVVEATPGLLRVNLHFDFEERGVRLRTERGRAARIEVLQPDARALQVRIPRWAAEESVVLSVDGRAARPVMRGLFLHVPAGTSDGPRTIVVEHELPEETVAERIDGVDYRIRWRGDEITGISPNTDWLPFYPALP